MGKGTSCTSTVKRKNAATSSQAPATKKQKKSPKSSKALPTRSVSPSPSPLRALTPPPSQDTAHIQHITTHGGQQLSKAKKETDRKRCRSLEQFPAGPCRETVQTAYEKMRMHTLRTDAFPRNLHGLATVAWKKARSELGFIENPHVPQEMPPKVCSHVSFPAHPGFNLSY
jgi:hypothetical protein